MGDNLEEAQAKNTRKRRAKCIAEQQQGDLFIRSEHVADLFTVDRVEGALALHAGDTLHCFPGKNGDPVDVVRENRLVGTIAESRGGRVLLPLIGACRPAVVDSVCDMTGTLTVKLTME